MYNQLGSFCLSEPASGSDAFALQTRAKKDGNHWIINGSKMWITNSYEAEIFLIFANVDPSKGYKGVTCFIATKDMGIQIAKKEQKLGIRASSTCTLSFDDMKIPEENVIGEVGKGYKVLLSLRSRLCPSPTVSLHYAVDCNRDFERRPHRHRRSDARSRARRVRQSCAIHISACTIRPTRRYLPRHAVSDRSGRD